MAEAIKYVQGIGLENITAHEKDLLAYATIKLQSIPDLIMYR